MIVQAAVARHARAPLAIASLTLDEPGKGEILVRLVASGVAPADLEAIAGEGSTRFPFVPGGEGAGIVERVGAGVTSLEPGDAVVLIADEAGGAERPSLHGDDGPVHGFARGQSSFATHALCAATSAVAVAGDAPLEVLASLGGDVWAAAGATLDAFRANPKGALVIAGAGAGGLAAVLVARALQVSPIVVADPREDRRQLASELGATLAVHTDEDLAAVVAGITGKGARLAMDTTGHAAAVQACLSSLAEDGRAVLLRPCPAVADTRLLAATANLDPADVVATLAAWQADGRFPVERLVSFFVFEHIDDALAALAREEAVKPVVRFSVGGFGALDRARVEGAATHLPETSEPSGDPSPQRPETLVTDGGG